MKNEATTENMEKNIEISVATPEDVQGITEVMYKTWLATYPHEELGITIDDIEDRYKDSFTETSLQKRAEQIANIPKGQSLFLAKDKDAVVGICRVVITENKNQLQAIYILPEYQGRGIGNKLWERGKEMFNTENDIFVNVASYNKNAIAFYEKLGFKDTGKRWDDEKFILKSGAKIPEMELVIKADSN
jgi:ribosomal protein S18 acetylase RimI-like enzyme